MSSTCRLVPLFQQLHLLASINAMKGGERTSEVISQLLEGPNLSTQHESALLTLDTR
jgi:hypothetical protein